MVVFDSQQLDSLKEDSIVDIERFSRAEEATGKLQFQHMEDKLMHSVLENDQEKISEGKLLENAIDQGMSAFSPDVMFEQMVENYSIAKQIFGDSLIREATGYNPDYVEKNMHIPEFQRELKKRMEERLERLKKDNLINEQGIITEAGVELASLVMYMQELDHLIPKGMTGKRVHKKYQVYGDRADVKPYKREDRYKDIATRKSLKTAIRRGHEKILPEDLRSFSRKSKGEVYIIYALDASGSMKGKKISTCKRAGIALAFHAIQRRDKVGLIVFGTDVKEAIPPTRDFTRLLFSMTNIKAEAETDMAATIRKAVELFPNTDVTKHLLLLTDALPTKGDDPEESALEAASIASSAKVTMSIIGINLDEKGKDFAEKLVAIGKGKLYVVTDSEEIDRIVLQDYYSVY